MPNIGVIQFMPMDSFFNPSLGLSPEAKLDKMLEDVLEEGPSKAQITSSWPQVSEAIRRDGLFVIETNTPAFRAMLKFDPDHPGAGEYEIHRQQSRRPVERGHVVKVIPVADDDRDPRVSMLTQFPTRFIVITVDSERPHTKLSWRVGLNEFRTVELD